MYTCTHVNSVCHFLEGLLSIIFRRETGVWTPPVQESVS